MAIYPMPTTTTVVLDVTPSPTKDPYSVQLTQVDSSVVYSRATSVEPGSFPVTALYSTPAHHESSPVGTLASMPARYESSPFGTLAITPSDHESSPFVRLASTQAHRVIDTATLYPSFTSLEQEPSSLSSVVPIIPPIDESILVSSNKVSYNCVHNMHFFCNY